MGPVHYSATLASNGVLELYPAEVADNARLGFAVSDLEGTMSKLERAGINIIVPPRETPYGYYGLVKDPDGRSVELHCEPA